MIVKLLELKDLVKKIGDKYWIYIKIAVKLVVAVSMILMMNSEMGYNKSMGNVIFIAGLSLISAFSPDAVFAMIVAVISLVQIYTVSPVLAVAVLVVYLIMFFAYVRFVPKQIFVIIAIPFLYVLNIPYVIPLICGVFFAPYAVFSNVCGILIYYVFLAIEKASGLSGDAGVSNMLNFFNVIVDEVRGNKYMLFCMIIFSFVTLITYIISRQKMNRSSDIGVITGDVILLISFVLSSSLIEGSDSIVKVIIGVLVSGVIAYVATFFRFSLDYSGTKNIQFEDEEYYYYVKAVPKLSVAAPEKQVKTIHAQVPTSNTMNLKETIEKVFEESEKNVTASLEDDK